MSLTAETVKKIAHLAKLNVKEENLAIYTGQLSHILKFVEQMNEADTSHSEALTNPLELPERLRPDDVTETNQRECFQKIAPDVQAGLYLVPKVIEGG